MHSINILPAASFRFAVAKDSERCGQATVIFAQTTLENDDDDDDDSKPRAVAKFGKTYRIVILVSVSEVPRQFNDADTCSVVCHSSKATLYRTVLYSMHISSRAQGYPCHLAAPARARTTRGSTSDWKPRGWVRECTVTSIMHAHTNCKLRSL